MECMRKDIRNAILEALKEYVSTQGVYGEDVKVYLGKQAVELIEKIQDCPE